jgi:hypothetical protein
MQKLIAISMNTLQLQLLELSLAIHVNFIKELVQLLLVQELVIILLKKQDSVTSQLHQLQYLTE